MAADDLPLVPAFPRSPPTAIPGSDQLYDGAVLPIAWLLISWRRTAS